MSLVTTPGVVRPPLTSALTVCPVSDGRLDSVRRVHSPGRWFLVDPAARGTRLTKLCGADDTPVSSAHAHERLGASGGI